MAIGATDPCADHEKIVCRLERSMISAAESVVSCSAIVMMARLYAARESRLKVSKM
jgi:hypothetical protein